MHGNKIYQLIATDVWIIKPDSIHVGHVYLHLPYFTIKNDQT